tara:strand:+ start:452 stop:1618 length:1167 start_codon:yes stop_codon:yes gene_type:complete
MFVFEQWAQASHPIFVQFSWITNVVGGLIVVLAAFMVLAKKRTQRKSWSFGTKSVWALFVFAFLSIAWSETPATGLGLWAAKFPYLLTALILVPWIVKGERDLMPVYRIFLVVSLILTAVIYTTTQWDVRRIVLGGSSGEIVGNPLEVATLAGVLMVVAVLYAEGKLVSVWSVLRICAILVGTLVIIRSGSRGQMLAFILVASTVAPLKYKFMNPKFVISAIFVLTIAAVTMNYAIQEYWQEDGRWKGEQVAHDTGGRLLFSKTLITQWFDKSSAIVVGLGNSSSYDLIGIYGHNVTVEILTEEGFVGFLFYFSFLFWLLYMGLKRIRDAKLAPAERDTIYIAAAVFLYFFILSFKQGSLIGAHVLFMSGIVLSELVKRRSGSASDGR